MTSSTPSPPIDDLSDPRAIEARGTKLAELLRGHEPSVVLAWETPASIVLGHIVARELGAASVRCYDRDGLVAFDGRFPEAGSAALVGVSLDRTEHVRAMIALAEQQGQRVVVAGALAIGDQDAADEVTGRGIAVVASEPTGDAHV